MDNSGQSSRELSAEINTEDTTLMNFNSKLKILPSYLIELFKETRYYKESSFLSIHEKDIEEIETFAREQLHLLVDKKDYVKYYGPLFFKRPEMFKIIGGFKKQIFALSQQLQKETQASNKNVNKNKIYHKRKRDDLSDNEKNSDSITRTNRFTFRNEKN